MVGGTDNYCIEFGLFKQFSVIEEFFCVGEAIACTIKGIGIGIAQSDDVFGADGIQIAGATASDTDGTDIEPIVGTEDPAVGTGRVGNKACGRCGGSCGDRRSKKRSPRLQSDLVYFLHRSSSDLFMGMFRWNLGGECDEVF